MCLCSTLNQHWQNLNPMAGLPCQPESRAAAAAAAVTVQLASESAAGPWETTGVTVAGIQVGALAELLVAWQASSAVAPPSRCSAPGTVGASRTIQLYGPQVGLLARNRPRVISLLR
jgi:hypothetical protein